jgi:hypothetical protein
MKALAYLLGSRAANVASDHRHAPPRTAESDLLPFASTPERAAAWRRWADEPNTGEDRNVPMAPTPIRTPRIGPRRAPAPRGDAA